MVQNNPETNLPELPDDYIWRIEHATYNGEPYLNLLIGRVRKYRNAFTSFWMRKVWGNGYYSNVYARDKETYFVHYKRKEVRPSLTIADTRHRILATAEEMAKTFWDEYTKNNLSDIIRATFHGEYPPKTL